jgi:hypothetical protein
MSQVRYSLPPASTLVMGEEKMTKIYGTSTKLIWSGAFGFTELTDGNKLATAMANADPSRKSPTPG